MNNTERNTWLIENKLACTVCGDKLKVVDYTESGYGCECQGPCEVRWEIGFDKVPNDTLTQRSLDAFHKELQIEASTLKLEDTLSVTPVEIMQVANEAFSFNDLLEGLLKLGESHASNSRLLSNSQAMGDYWDGIVAKLRESLTELEGESDQPSLPEPDEMKAKLEPHGVQCDW